MPSLFTVRGEAPTVLVLVGISCVVACSPRGPTPTLCMAPLTQSIDHRGGSIRVTAAQNPQLGGTILTVPANVFSEKHDIELTCGPELADPRLEVAVGASVHLSQAHDSDLTATLTLPYDPGKIPPGFELAIATRIGDDIVQQTGTSVVADPLAGTVQTEIARLGDYQVIAVSMDLIPLPATPPATKDVDVLFVLDNSPSVAEKQSALVRNIQGLLQKLDEQGLDYHLGFVSTDVGSTIAPGRSWGGSIGSCDTFEGDDGILQAEPCTNRSSISPVARNACATLCPDPSFRPIDSRPFIAKEGGLTNVKEDMQRDPDTGLLVDVGPRRAFQCLALLGDSGCGLESPLASALRALDGHRRENSGFVRPGSLLAVIFLTDEDDCSAQLARRRESAPGGMDCPTPDQNAPASCFSFDYRCLAASVQCDQPMNTAGDKTNCRERPGNYLEPIPRYINFFRRLSASHRLVVAGLWTLPALDHGGHLKIVGGGGPFGSWGLNRGSSQDASCVYAGDSAIFAAAQRRLSALVAGIPGAQEFSVCDLDGIGSTLSSIGQSIGDAARRP